MKPIDQSAISGKHALYGAGHVPSLTGLRAVGAFLIIIYHFHKMPGTVLEPFVAAGGILGLMIFFSLSGYIMSYVHHDLPLNEGIRPCLAFIWRRLARIYPLHLFLIILALFFFPPLPMVMLIGPKELLQSLTLTHAWFANWSFIQASWSISVEFLFYLLFPLLLFMRYGAVTAVLVFLAGASLYAGIHTGIMPFPPELRPHSVHFVFFYGSFFPLGMAVFFATRRFAILRRLLDNNWAFLALLGAIVASPLLPGQYYLGLLAFTVPLLIRAAHTASLSARLIGNPLMVFFGEISYALYLSHQLIYGIVARLAEHVPADPIYIWSSNYLLLLIWSYLCYRLVELPSRKGMRAMWNGGQGAPKPAASAAQAA